MTFSRRRGDRFNRGRIDDSGGSGFAFSTATIPGLVLLLENTLITVESGRVSAWPDLSGAGNHFTQGTPSLQPLYVASETDFPVPQPGVKDDSSTRRLVGPVLSNIVWIAAVAEYPATTFARDAVLMSSTVLTNGYPLWGVSGAATWRDTLIPAGTNTRYRNGVQTNTALTTANTPHLYELILGTPWTSPGNVQLGTDVANLQWDGTKSLIMAATAVPSAATRDAILAEVRRRGMVA